MKKVSMLIFGVLISSAAFGQLYEGTTVSESFTREGVNIEGESQFETTLESDIYRVTSEYRWVNERVWECEDDGDGDGSKGDWKRFYNVPKDQKAGALADAIKGVGLSTAKRLVSDNYFHSKPRSWRQFSNVINDADDQYKTGFSYEVLVKFKKENMVNLGYLVEGECGYVTKRIYKRVPVKKYHRTARKTFIVSITNAPLLGGEKETFRVIFDGFENDIRVSSRYAKYVSRVFEEDGKTFIDLEGTRQLVSPPNTLDVHAKRDGSRLILNIRDNGFLGDIEDGVQKIVDVTVKKDGFLLFNKTLAKFSHELSQDDALTVINDIDATVKRKMKIIVQYQVRVNGSKYYNNQKSGTLTHKTRL